MPIVVDDDLPPDLLNIEPWSLRAKGSSTNRDRSDAIGTCVKARELQSRCGFGTSSLMERRHTTARESSDRRKRACSNQHPAPSEQFVQDQGPPHQPGIPANSPPPIELRWEGRAWQELEHKARNRNFKGPEGAVSDIAPIADRANVLAARTTGGRKIRA